MKFEKKRWSVMITVIMLRIVHYYIFPSVFQLPSCCRSGGAKCTHVWMARSVKFFQTLLVGPAAPVTKSKPPRWVGQVKASCILLMWFVRFLRKSGPHLLMPGLSPREPGWHRKCLLPMERGASENLFVAIKVPFKQSFLRVTIYAIKTIPRRSIHRRCFFEDPFSQCLFLRQTILQSNVLLRPYFYKTVL